MSCPLKNENNVEHVINMTCSFNDLRTKFTSSMAKNTGISSNKGTDLSQDDNWMSITTIAPICLHSLEYLNICNNNTIYLLMIEYLKSFKAIELGSSNLNIWHDTILQAIRIEKIFHTNNIELIIYIMEAWFYCPSIPYQQIKSFVEKVMNEFPNNIHALIAYMWNRVTEGLIELCDSLTIHCYRTLILYLNTLISNNSTTSTSETSTTNTPGSLENSSNTNNIKLNDSFSDISLGVIIAVSSIKGFQLISEKDALSASFLAIQKISKREEKSGMIRDGFHFMIKLARLRALALVSSLQKCKVESITLLPSLFQWDFVEMNNQDDTNKISLMTNEFNTYENTSKLNMIVNTVEIMKFKYPYQWYITTYLSSCGFYSIAIQVCESIRETNPVYTSWLISELHWNKLLLHIHEQYNQQRIVLLKDCIIHDSLYTVCNEGLRAALSSVENPLLVEAQQVTLLYRLGVLHWLGGGTKRSVTGEGATSLLSCIKLDNNHHGAYW